ncbi:MAG: SRPBCC family protein [Myxococcota bacterium]
MSMLSVLVIATAVSASAERAEGSIRNFTHTEVTTAAPNEVWARWMDVAGWPTWDTELTSAQADAPLALGVTGTLESGGRTSPFEVIGFEPDRRYTYEVPLPAGRLVVERHLEPLDNGGTRFTHTVSLKGFGGWLLGPMLGRGFRAALPGVMQALKNQAEAG